MEENTYISDDVYSDEDGFNSDEDFDTEWVKKIEEENKLYHDFFITQNESVKLNINYINSNNVYDSKVIKIKLKNGYLKKDDLIILIRKNMIFHKKKHRLLSILTYNFDLDNINIKNYYKKMDNYNFLYTHNELKTLKWENTINYFKDLNEIFFFYVEKRKEKQNNKKKIIITNKLKKTKKKRLKY